jgi:hypothetical protein
MASALSASRNPSKLLDHVRDEVKTPDAIRFLNAVKAQKSFLINRSIKDKALIYCLNTRSKDKKRSVFCKIRTGSAFTDEVNCITDNEKEKAFRVVGVRSARGCVTMPRAAN